MRDAHPVDHLATLTPADARRAAWSPLDPDIDYAWTEEVHDALQVASAALLQAARAIAGTGAHGRALRAVAGRFGAVEAALMVPAAAEACSRAAARIEDVSGIMRGELLVMRAAEALLGPTIH